MPPRVCPRHDLLGRADVVAGGAMAAAAHDEVGDEVGEALSITVEQQREVLRRQQGGREEEPVSARTI